MNVPLYIAIMAVLVLMSAYFSATETAFSSLSKTRLKLLSEENKKAALAYKLSENYDKLISTILIGNNIVNIALASLGTVMFVHLMENDDLAATISTVVVTIVVLIFGEVTPKGIAKDFPEKFATFSAPMINVLIFILTPLSFLLSLIKKLISKIFGNKGNTTMSQEELLLIVDEVEQEGVIDQDESELLHNAIEFSELCAEDILTHRVDLEAVSVDADKEEIAHVFSTTKFSRLLVYEENIDNIVGVIHQKDFYSETSVTPRSLKEIMTPPIFILKNEKIDDLLRRLQQNKSHIAVILDEYGGTYGIVTMEDILEELVGDIWDDTDVIITECRATGENTYEVLGDMNIDDFFDEIDFIKPENFSCEYSTMGGWAIEMLEADPHVGDSFRYENIFVIVAQMEEERVTKLTVLVEKKEDEEEIID